MVDILSQEGTAISSNASTQHTLSTIDLNSVYGSSLTDGVFEVRCYVTSYRTSGSTFNIKRFVVYLERTGANAPSVSSQTAIASAGSDVAAATVVVDISSTTLRLLVTAGSADVIAWSGCMRVVGYQTV